MQGGGYGIVEGDVKVVVIIAINQQRSKITIEKWKMAPPITRSIGNYPLAPTRIQQITINRNANTGVQTVMGASLVLEVLPEFSPPCCPAGN